MNKKKLLIWSDSPSVKTGFGVVAHNLFTDLYKDFDVSILGINYFGLTRYDTSKYFIYAVDRQDPMGFERFGLILNEVKPDTILLFQDIFNIQHVLGAIKQYSTKVPIIAYFPIDGTPVNPYWRPALDTPDKLVTYTQWGIEKILDVHPHLKNIEYLYHGVNFGDYHLLPSSPRRKFKEEAGWNDKFVIMSNNRFQPRKVLGLGLRATALFTKGYKKCTCGNIYLRTKKKCDLNNCTMAPMYEVDGHSDVLVYMHANMSERTMGPGPANALTAQAMNAGYLSDDINKQITFFGGNAYDSPLSENQLCILYNVADVNISTSLGEGVGLSLIEAMACGTTNIAPDHSSIPEMLGDTGHIVPNVGFVNIAMDNAHLRPVVNIEKFVAALEIEYQKWIANGRKKVVNQAGIDRAKLLFQWQDKRDKMLGWLKSA